LGLDTVTLGHEIGLGSFATEGNSNGIEPQKKMVQHIKLKLITYIWGLKTPSLHDKKRKKGKK
jgi:hypothetical protein